MKDIKGYEGLYAITSCGKVWSYRSNRFLIPRIVNGYSQVTLRKNSKGKSYYIHRLVAEAYIPNPENKSQVNHINEIKSHNYIANLEWVTPKENMNFGTRKERANRATAKKVYCVEIDKIFDSVSSAAKEIGCSAGNISNCLKGRYKTCAGYHWEYAQI